MRVTKSRPLVTIVIPAYNHERYVEDAITSVLNQYYENWELIVINDGSTDKTGQVCDKFATHKRIKVIHQENTGLSKVLNKALDMAKGRYFGFLPSDDMFYPEKLLIQVDYLESHPELAGVGSNQTLIDGNGKPLHIKEMEEWFSYIPTSRTDFLLKLLERNFVPAPSMLLKTDLLREVGGFDPQCRFMQDYDLWFRILKNHDMKILPKPLIYYRWHGHNLTYQATPETETERGLVFEKAARLLEITDLYPELWTELRPEVLALCRIDLHQRLSVNPTPNFEEVHGIFDEKFTALWRKRKKLDIPIQAIKKLVPAYLTDTGKPSVIIEITSLDKGGLEQVVHDLALGLSHKGVPVTVVCVREGGLIAKRLVEKGVRVEILPLNNKEDAYRHIISETKARIINAHYSTFGAKLAFEHAIPFVTTVHNIYAWLPEFEKGGIRDLDHLTCHYIAVSEDVREYLNKKFGIGISKISVIPNGLNISFWEAQYNKKIENTFPGIQGGDYIFLTTAAISRLKGQDRIIRALSRMAHDCPHAKAVMVGPIVDYTFYTYLKNLVKELGIEERIIFHSFEENLVQWYRRADAFVLPSLFEGWSISMLEAMFAGLPLIMTNVAGAKTAIIEASSGILIDPPYKRLLDLGIDFLEKYTMSHNDGMVESLADAMKNFYLHRTKWEEAGRRGRQLVIEKYNLDVQINNYWNLFNKIIIDFSSKFVEFFNHRFKNLEKALEFSQRTLEKVYEGQRQGYWLNTLNHQLHEAWENINNERQQNINLLHEIDKLNHEIEMLKTELDTIYNSRAWKLLQSGRKIKRSITKGHS